MFFSAGHKIGFAHVVVVVVVVVKTLTGFALLKAWMGFAHVVVVVVKAWMGFALVLLKTWMGFPLVVVVVVKITDAEVARISFDDVSVILCSNLKFHW